MLSNIELKKYFTEIMGKQRSFRFGEDNPFMINYRGSNFFVFLKNISSAHFKNSPDITRVQLPFSEHYRKILDGEVPFIILGYDQENDIFVNWDPYKLRTRLNTKQNVSLYSRRSLQSHADKSKLNVCTLTNGSKFLILASDLLPTFFQSFHNLYGHSAKGELQTNQARKTEAGDTDRISEITDDQLLNEIIPLVKANRVLDAAVTCYQYYQGRFRGMKMADWLNVVNRLHSKVSGSAHK